MTIGRTMPATGPQLGDLLCFAIYSAGHSLNRIYKPLLEALGLTYTQYLVMTILWAEDDQTVGQIGDRLFLESSTLTPLLKRLEASSLLTRRRDRADERVVRVALTAQGRALQEDARHVPACILEASGQDIEGIRKLRVEIETLRDALDRSGNTGDAR